MTIKVLNYIYYDKGLDKSEFEMEVEAPIKVRDILLRASIPLELFGIAISRGKVLTLNDEVLPGSEVRLLPPVGGG